VPLLNTTKEDFSTYNTAWNGASDARPSPPATATTTRSVFALSEIGSSGDGVPLHAQPEQLGGFSASDASTASVLRPKRRRSRARQPTLATATPCSAGSGFRVKRASTAALLEDNVSKGSTRRTRSSRTSTLLASPPACTSSTSTTGRPLTPQAITSRCSREARRRAIFWLLQAARSTRPLARTRSLPRSDYGNGRIVLLSDPSVFINDMLGQADNQQLLTSMVANLTGR